MVLLGGIDRPGTQRAKATLNKLLLVNIRSLSLLKWHLSLTVTRVLMAPLQSSEGLTQDRRALCELESVGVSYI